MNDEETPVGVRLNALLVAGGMKPLEATQTSQFEKYLALLLRWNTRTNLTAVRDEDGILARHFVESIACARALPEGIETLLDFGSGAGFPGIPVALCRPEMDVTLAEAQGKKVAFLQEAARVLGISVHVYSGRAELLKMKYKCITLRAVDRMDEAVEVASQLVAPAGWLAVMTTHGDVVRLQARAGAGFSWENPISMPGGAERVLALGRLTISLQA
jgi:16S rRNA (guanine527-N7)-methyltransferase